MSNASILLQQLMQKKERSIRHELGPQGVQQALLADQLTFLTLLLLQNIWSSKWADKGGGARVIQRGMLCHSS